MDWYIIKKDGTEVKYDFEKIWTAVNKSAERVLVELTPAHKAKLQAFIGKKLKQLGIQKIPVLTIHSIVELALKSIKLDDVYSSYSEYRNWKLNFAKSMDSIYQKSKMIDFRGDNHSNANSDEALVSTKRCLLAGELNRELYKMFNLTGEERQACKDGFIYIHDQSSRRDTYNCCLFNISAVIDGGFTMGTVKYTEPKSIDAAMDVLGDVILSVTSNQYGGWSARIDDALAKYVDKSYKMYVEKYTGISKDLSSKINKSEWIHEHAMADVVRDTRQGMQGLEMKLNSVGSSRGDYPFVSFVIGLGTSWQEQLITRIALEVRMAGQGEVGNKRPVVFPKLIFLYDKNLHGPKKELEYLFNLAIKCSAKAMYPDYLSLTGDDYVGTMYKKYGAVVFPMGCRAFLGPWYERGGFTPADEADKPVYVGRFNLGAITLNLIMIYQEAKVNGYDFWERLEYYMNMARQIHIRTYQYLSKKKASMSPLAFCEGGLYGGNLKPDECIGKILQPCTLSFGVTGLNELNVLHNGKTIYQDGEFPLEVMKKINELKNKWKAEDRLGYAIYGTPAESLAGLQITQFRAKYGIIKGVSDRDYTTNSFHCHVSEDITPSQKQDAEERFWGLFEGGRIQYVRYNNNKNISAIKKYVRRAMSKGFYEGVNLCLSYCDDCGHEELNMEKCPKCGSTAITQIDRVIGYLGFTKIAGDTRMNDAKLAEIKDRVSM